MHAALLVELAAAAALFAARQALAAVDFVDYDAAGRSYTSGQALESAFTVGVEGRLKVLAFAAALTGLGMVGGAATATA